MNDIKSEIAMWADANMERDAKSKIYPMWEKMWIDDNACCTMLRKLRLCGTDKSADIVVLTCLGGYGGNEKSWKGVNLGQARSVKQIVKMFDWLEEQTLYERDGE